MGQLVWDASQRRDHRAASQYFKQTISIAQQFRIPSTEGKALLRTSFVALYGQRDPEAGLRLTKQARRVVGGASNVISGLSVLHSAEAYAMLGFQRDCEAALNDASSYIDVIDLDDPAIEIFSPTQHGRLTGSCYLSLHQEKRAQSILEETEKQLRDKSKSRSIVLGNLALSCIRQRNLEQAAEILHKAIDAVETTWGGGGLNVVFAAAGELNKWRDTTVVRDVHDRLLTLMATR